MIIEVTQEHIDKGKPGNAFKCPIAYAVKERLFNEFAVEVNNGIHIYENYEPDKGVYDTQVYFVDFNEEMEEFIDKFDEGGEVEPIELFIDLPHHIAQ